MAEVDCAEIYRELAIADPAEIMQIFMRGGGRSVVQRRANGFPGVKLLTIESDYKVFKGLDDMTVAAAAQMPDFTAGEYPHEMREVVGCKRPHCRKKLKMDFKRARYAAPVKEQPALPVPTPAPRRRGGLSQKMQLLVLINTMVGGSVDAEFTSVQMRQVPEIDAIQQVSQRRALRALVKDKCVWHDNTSLHSGIYKLTSFGIEKIMALRK